MTTLLNYNNIIYTQFLSLLDDLDKFMNSSYFTIFTLNASSEELNIWDNIVISTDMLLEKTNKENNILDSILDDIIYYNDYVTVFYQEIISKYALVDTKKILSQFMIQK